MELLASNQGIGEHEAKYYSDWIKVPIKAYEAYSGKWVLFSAPAERPAIAKFLPGFVCSR
jgi:hypothetical protein